MNPPQRSSWVPGAKGDAMYQKALAKYNQENNVQTPYAQEGNPTLQKPVASVPSVSASPPPASSVPTPSVSKPSSNYSNYAQDGNPTMSLPNQGTSKNATQSISQATPQPGMPSAQPSGTQMTQSNQSAQTITTGATQGFDEKALLNAGISQAQIDQMKAVMGAGFQSSEAQKTNAKSYNDFLQQDLKDEQKDVENMYSDIKKKKEELNQQSLSIVDQTAKVQQEISDQEYQKSKFANEQAQKQYELDTNRAERKQEQANDDNELRMRRAVSAQLGASYGSMGLEMITKSKQRGEEILSDLRAQTAIGKAEFAFKAIDIEKSYSNALKEISTNQQSLKLNLVKELQGQLDDIDEKILSSKEDKRKETRDAMKDYYDKLNDIETASADKITVAVEKMFTEKKELEEEKKQREAVNIDMSEALGYMANKYGDPIGVAEGEPPVPFTGNFNKELSQQFGYLVDAHGNAIMGSDRRRIPYADAEKQEWDNMMNMLGGMGINSMDGMAQFAQENPLEAQQLNGTFGENVAIANAKPNGASGGQCGTFARSQFTNEPGPWPSTRAQKRAWIDSKGIPKKNWVPKVGDIIIQDLGKWGHFAVINKIEVTPDGKRMARLSESNWRGDEKVNNTRVIDLDDPKNAIYGAYRTQLKKPYASAMPKVAPDFGESEGVQQKMPKLGSLSAKKGIPSMMGGGLNLSNLSAEGKKQLQEAVSSGNPAKLKGALFALQAGLFNQSEDTMTEKEKLELEGLKYDVQSKKYKAENPESITNPYEAALKELVYKDKKMEVEQKQKGKQLADSAVQNIIKVQGIADTLKSLENTMQTVEPDPYWGWARQLNPLDEDAQQFENIKNLLTGPTTKGIMQEVGALTADDLRRMEKSIPSIKDTPKVAQNKLNTLKELISKLQKGTLSKYKQAGYDVSGFLEDSGQSGTITGSSGYTFGGGNSVSSDDSSSYDEYF